MHMYNLRKLLLARINDSTFELLKTELAIDIGHEDTIVSKSLNDSTIDTSTSSFELGNLDV
jgi:hypothetical protein